MSPENVVAVCLVIALLAVIATCAVISTIGLLQIRFLLDCHDQRETARERARYQEKRNLGR